jgi:tRNA U34 5-methylaminomethyl-2-thiouridine-forming methyltransferase MnmC
MHMDVLKSKLVAKKHGFDVWFGVGFWSTMNPSNARNGAQVDQIHSKAC